MHKIKGENILITGAASGLGKLLSYHFAKDGGNLILLDINEKGLIDVTSHIIQNINSSIKISTFKVDLSNREEIISVIDKIKDKFNFIDIIVNNAGIVNGKSFFKTSIEEIEKNFKINTLAHFWLIKGFLDDMIKNNKGHIVTISSAAGIIGVNKLSDYCASKFAVFGFTESLRMEFKKLKLNIKTTIISPFYINTGMFKGVKSRVPLLLPILDQNKTALKMYNAIKKEKPLLLMPQIVRSVWFFRLISVKFLDWAANLLGINNSMDEFKGRK